jgi:hypothetical protein
MKLNNFIVLLFASNLLLAQHKMTAKIETVKESGLHKIVLPPEIRSFSKEELGDLRIRDAKGTEIPYYLVPQERIHKIPLFFSEYSILSKTVLPKNKTSLIFENPKTAIDAIVLCITNSDVTKPYQISGSNDQKEWFGLVNTARLDQLVNKEETLVFKTIKFPLTSYRYIKIEFDDKKTLPINVLKIGYFANKTTFNTQVEIVSKTTKILQIPTKKKTQIYVAFDYPQIVNQISLEIKQPNLFQRNARIFVNKKRAGNQKGSLFSETLANFELNSNHTNSFSIPQLFERNFFIEIDNRDNPALTVSKIRFFQNPVWVIADLKIDEKYSITTANPTLNSPEYDLENFKNSIDPNLPEAKIYDIKHLNSRKTALSKTSIWQQPWFMWLCISLGGLTILFFTGKLVKDMKKNPPN